MKSFSVKTSFIEVWNIYTQREVFMKLMYRNFEDYFPLNHGWPDCVTVTIVTDLNPREKKYLTCDWRNTLSYIHQWGLRCGAVGCGTVLWTVKVAGSIPDAVIKGFQRINPTRSPQALNTTLCRLSGNYWVSTSWSAKGLIRPLKG